MKDNFQLLAFCNEVKRILKLPLPDGDSCESRLCFLSSVLQNQGKGKPGAGLTGGILQESLWKDMFFSQSPDRFSEPEEKDADYCFDGVPLSHKTIGWSGTGDLALHWSKNPASGLQRTQFNSSMVIACTRRPMARGVWEGLEMGLYVIPVDWLKENVELSNNNKTTALIKTKYTREGMRYACNAGLHVALHYDHFAGVDHSLSFWTLGRSAAVRFRSAEESPPSTLFPPHQ
jgi:hypothetical protein